MKKAFVLALAIVSFQSAFADVRVDVRLPNNGNNKNRDELPMCLKNLDNANRRINDLQSQLISCQNSNRPGRETEELRRENSRLNEQVNRLNSDNRSLSESISRLNYDNNNLVDSNNRLMRENMDLRRQLDDLQGGGRGLGFITVAGCKDYTGKVDTKYLQASEGRVELESQTLATQKVSSNYSCSYGIAILKSEEIRTTQANNYCVAGCKDYTGKVDTKYIKSGMGRNVTEAQYNAMKDVAKNFSCSYGIEVQACQ